MTSIDQLRDIIENEIGKSFPPTAHHRLYDPIAYLMGLGGKRLRPIFCLLSAEMFGAQANKALPAAMAVEIFHNFSLIHDDIMDDAPMRRGQSTVHEKWNVAQGILSGDAALVLAYNQLMTLPEEHRWHALQGFNKMALEVCEGQQLDMDFEIREDVRVEDYLEMIRLKTSVLLATSLKTGALIGGASPLDCALIYDFGINLGLSFQLRDDYLDTFGDERIGKQIGGDILADKKTYLLIRSNEKAGKEEAAVLNAYIGSTGQSAADKVHQVRSVMQKLKVDEDAEALSKKYYTEAMDMLEKVGVPDARKVQIKSVSRSLLGRDR
jgi:geranylgeranyl diphosphate synthase, type II